MSLCNSQQPKRHLLGKHDKATMGSEDTGLPQTYYQVASTLGKVH